MPASARTIATANCSSRRYGVRATAGLWLVVGCAASNATDPLPPVTVVREVFVTAEQRASNKDSPAVWLGSAGHAWVLTTGKASHRLYVDDAVTGAAVRTVGRRGAGPGEFRRPNGIAVIGDLALVVERDNRRVQVLRLPDFEPVTSFGEDVLRRPYGIAVHELGGGEFQLFITDDYRGFLRHTLRDRDLDERVKRFDISSVDGSAAVRYAGAFGETSGPGRLIKVESIAIDPEANVLLIADERSRDVKVYGTDGTFTGRVLWGDLLRHEPEGIVLYRCGDGGGYWIIADQHRRDNRFLVFHRRTFELAGAFTGVTVRNTDGAALVQQRFGRYAAGALYALHDDRAVGAFDWSEVAAALGLRSDCT